MVTTQLFKLYAIKLLLFTLLLCVIIWILQYLSVPLVHEYIWYIIAFFFIQSFITFFIAERGIKKGKGKFVSHYFTSMTLRLVLTIILVFVFISKQMPDLYVFVSNLLVLYLFFLVFEIYSLLTNLRANSENQAKNDI